MVNKRQIESEPELQMVWAQICIQSWVNILARKINKGWAQVAGMEISYTGI